MLREVLVGLMEDDPTLQPRDIIVMCPDVDAYAPLIQAAFGLGADVAGPAVGAHPAHRLRVRLADRGLAVTNPLLGVARQESTFNTWGMSHAGARGLLQLMPRTAHLMARALRVPYNQARLTADPDYNILLGRHYLGVLLDRFGSKSADVEGSSNLIGIKDPAIDALVNLAVSSHTRPELVARLRALDRVLRHGYYVVPQYYSTTFRIAYRAGKFEQPKVMPQYYQAEDWVISTWWRKQ